MKIITLDFETYYDAEYTLSRASTSEYIRDERFHVQMVGIKIGAGPTHTYIGDRIQPALGRIKWEKSLLLCHHTAFDGFILTEHFGHRPKYYLDTLSMARAALPGMDSYSLNNVAKALKLGQKIADTLAKTKGNQEWSRALAREVSVYCKQDIDLAWAIYQKLLPEVPQSELDLIDLTLRMFCEPVLQIDTPLVERELEKEVGGKVAALFRAGVAATDLVSRPKFAKLLQDNGVTPPVKISKTTGKSTYALAKDDEGFRALLQHEDEKIRHLAEARIKLCTSQGETRARRFITEGADGRALPVYYNYRGAHTGRWSGGNRMNLQNLPRGGQLRRSVLAPKGQVLVVCDSAQIEARVTAWFAEEKKLLEGFRSLVPGAKHDVYTAFAGDVYARPVDTSNKVERHLGKTCILGLGFQMGAGRLQETLKNGQIPILMEEKECARIVHYYRSLYPKIPHFWRLCEKIIKAMATNGKGEYKCISWAKRRILLPCNLFLYYKGLAPSEDEEGFVFYSGKGQRTHLYGGLLTENIVQGTARDIVAAQMLEIAQEYRVVMMTHDEIVYLAPEKEAEQALAFGLGIMSKTPSWAPGLPLAAEGGYDACYSK